MTSKEIFNQKMTALADAINEKANTTGKKNLDEMIEIVDSFVADTSFSITCNIVNGTVTGSTNTFGSPNTAQITIVPNENHVPLPTSILVTGATYSYDASTYTITLTDATADITISVECIYALPVGGKIFFIGEDNGATYTFYDENMNEVVPAIGDTPAWYKITGTPSTDKYYIFDPEYYTGKKWTYYTGSGFKFEIIPTSEAFGDGKNNTNAVMTKDDGAYIASGTIWYEIYNRNTNGAIHDWYLGSYQEVGKLLTTKVGSTYIAAPAKTGQFGSPSSSDKQDAAKVMWVYLRGYSNPKQPINKDFSNASTSTTYDNWFLIRSM